jgi:hypothetical protein
MGESDGDSPSKAAPHPRPVPGVARDWKPKCLAIGVVGLLVGGLACSHGASPPTTTPPTPPGPGDLRINEVVSRNQGVWVDEFGETDDYVELVNTGTVPADLSRYKLADSSHTVGLPSMTLAPNQIVLVWADSQPEQGGNHLGIKVDGDGETLTLLREGDVVDRVAVPALAAHHAFVRIPDGTGPFADCGWATPARENGTRCGPPPTPELPEDSTYAPYPWPVPWPPLATPLALTELALRPAGFIEVLNTSDAVLSLADYRLTVAPHTIGAPWPVATDGSALAWPVAALGSGQRIAVPLSEADLSAVAATARFEGVVSIWSADGTNVDRQDFSFFPEGSSLTRFPEPDGAFRFCVARTPGLPNTDCQPLQSRPVGDHLRALSTPGDFAALAGGRGDVGESAVEVVIDMTSGDVVALLNSATWDIHYCFVREVIQGLPHLDRCDPPQQAEFNMGWYDFSVTEYFHVEGRRYLLATLVEHAGSNLHTLEYTPGDTISPEQMVYGFFATMRHVPDPTQWFLRPQDSTQVAKMRQIEGQVPIVDTNAPFRGLTFQPLVPTVGYGTLRFVAADGIETADLSPHDILVTDQVPYAIPLLAGLITESFQTPLSHVNVLSRGRGTPNMGLKNAREDARLKPLLGKLVRLEVRGSDFLVAEADPAEALAFWESHKPQSSVSVPRLDPSVRGLVALDDSSIADIPTIGSKAAQLAELGKVPLCSPSDGKVPETRIPTNAFAIPFAYSVEHFAKSGAAARLASLRTSQKFNADPTVRQEGLTLVQSDITKTDVDPELLRLVRERMSSQWPGQNVRLRSSSNTEDLPQFNGAGLYTSAGMDAESSAKDLANGIREVWASLWRLRAYDEREYYNIDQSSVAMAVLIHEAFSSEKANGVAISRDILEPSRGDKFYINAQVGEALVTNPAPGVTSDEFTYALGRTPHIERQSVSSLNGGRAVLSDEESYRVACSLARIHDHFRPLVDPEAKNSWFAMDVELKLIGPNRQLVIKQARPYSFGQEAPMGWCDL